MAKILVADDEVDLEMLIKQKFRQKIREQEYEFIFAVNGKDALEKGSSVHTTSSSNPTKLDVHPKHFSENPPCC